MPGSIAVRSIALLVIVALVAHLGCAGEVPSELGDFREADWEDLAMTPEGGIYTPRLLPHRKDGYMAVFGDADYSSSDGFSFSLSTRVSIFQDGDRVSR